MSSDYDPDANDGRDESMSKTTRRGLLGALGVAGVASLGSSGASAQLGGGPEADAMSEYRVPTYRVPESDLDSPGVVGREVTITSGGATYETGDQLVDLGDRWELVSPNYGSVNTEQLNNEIRYVSQYAEGGSGAFSDPYTHSDGTGGLNTALSDLPDYGGRLVCDGMVLFENEWVIPETKFYTQFDFGRQGWIKLADAFSDSQAIRLKINGANNNTPYFGGPGHGRLFYGLSMFGNRANVSATVDAVRGEDAGDKVSKDVFLNPSIHQFTGDCFVLIGNIQRLLFGETTNNDGAGIRYGGAGDIRAHGMTVDRCGQGNSIPGVVWEDGTAHKFLSGEITRCGPDTADGVQFEIEGAASSAIIADSKVEARPNQDQNAPYRVTNIIGQNHVGEGLYGQNGVRVYDFSGGVIDYQLREDFGDNPSPSGGLINSRAGTRRGDRTNRVDGRYQGVYRPKWALTGTEPSFSGESMTLASQTIDGLQRSPAVNQTVGSWEYRFEPQTTPSNGRLNFKTLTDNLDSSYQVLVYAGTGDVDLQKVDSGSASTLISGSWTPDANPHTVRLDRASGGEFELFFDGSSLGTATDTFLPPEDRFVGFQSNSAWNADTDIYWIDVY